MSTNATAASPIRGISSMATRQLLAELTQAYTAATGVPVIIESVGGVDAAKRVAAGEAFDVVILSADAVDTLIAGGHAAAGSRTDLVHSGVAVAVKAGAPHPSLADEAAVREAVRTATSVSVSTGPSGVALARLFDRWGIAAEIAPRLVTPPPGIPVGSLVARGEVALGLQQLSELIHVEGIDIVGPLPGDIQITTTFSGAICTTAGRPDAVRELLGFLSGPCTAAAKRRQGMEPA